MEPDPLLKPVEVLKTASYGLEVLALLPQLLISRMPTPTPEPANAAEPIAEDADKDEDGEGASAPAPVELTLGTNLHFIFRGLSRGIPVMLWWYNSALGRTSDEGMKLLVSRYAVSDHDNPAMLFGGLRACQQQLRYRVRRAWRSPCSISTSSSAAAALSDG